MALEQGDPTHLDAIEPRHVEEWIGSLRQMKEERVVNINDLNPTMRVVVEAVLSAHRRN